MINFFTKEQHEKIKNKFESDYNQLELLSKRLRGISHVKKGKGFMQIIDLHLLKKQKILLLKDKLGNTILSRKVNKDFVNLVTKRFNSKKKYKCSSIESFRLLNELFPISKRSKKVRLCTSKPIFYDNPRELIDHLDLILGSIEAGNNNLKNEGIAVIDELLKNGILNKKSHELIYKRFFN